VTFIALGTAIGIAAGWQGWFCFLIGTVFADVCGMVCAKA
jgi:hypothetical protein